MAALLHAHVHSSTVPVHRYTLGEALQNPGAVLHAKRSHHCSLYKAIVMQKSTRALWLRSLCLH